IREVVATVVALLCLALLAHPAAALVELDVTRGNIKPLPIALPAFVGDGELGPGIAEVITNDLQRSGLFVPIEAGLFPERPTDAAVIPALGGWRATNAEALVIGAAARQPDGRLKVEFRLWDVVAGQQMAGQQFFTKPDNWRRVAHIIADAIYERLTGEKGYFDTRVVFVEETGPKDRRVKRLAVMD